MTAACEICREHNECRRYDRTNLLASEPTTACCKILSAKSNASPDTPFGRTFHNNTHTEHINNYLSTIFDISIGVPIESTLTDLICVPHCESSHRSRHARNSIAFIRLDLFALSVAIVDGLLLMLGITRDVQPKSTDNSNLCTILFRQFDYFMPFTKNLSNQDESMFVRRFHYKIQNVCKIEYQFKVCNLEESTGNDMIRSETMFVSF